MPVELDFDKVAENAQKMAREAGERIKQGTDKTVEYFQSFQWQVDPDDLDTSLQELGEKLRRVYDQGRYTKVRLSFKGKQLLPDIPIGVLIAGEAASFWLIGPLRAIVFALGVKSFVDVELVHEASGRVREGIDLYMDGEVEQAEEKYREALRMKAGDAAALYNLGVLLRVTGRLDEALECFKEAARDEEHPDGARAREALGRMSL